MDESRWPAPAKLNLFLHVTGREQGGYHRIQTLFQLLDWGDELEFEVTDEHAVIRTRDVAGVSLEHDLCLRAARLLQQVAGVRRGVRITLHKRIPIGSGLGGGSSDAATVLCVLNSLWNCGLTCPELAELGLQLGADVPLFVHGRTSWGEGRGEILFAQALGERWYVLLTPGIEVSTREVFEDPRLERDTAPIRVRHFDLGNTRNDCQPVVYERHPELRMLAENLPNPGSWRMTGTGSTLFLPVADEGAAHAVTRSLKSRYNVRAVRGVDRSPLLERMEQSA